MYLKNTLAMLLRRSTKHSMSITPMIIWKNATIYSLIFCLSSSKFQLRQLSYLNNQLLMVWNPLIWCMQLEHGLTLIWRSNWRKIIQTTIQLRRNLASWGPLLTIITNSMIIPAAPNQLLEITRSPQFIATLPLKLLRLRILQATYWPKNALSRSILTARMLSSRIIMCLIWWLQAFHRMPKLPTWDRLPKPSMWSTLQSKAILSRTYALELAESKWGWVRVKTWNRLRPTSWELVFKFMMWTRTRTSSQFSATSRASWTGAPSEPTLMQSFQRSRTCRPPSPKLSGIIVLKWGLPMIL